MKTSKNKEKDILSIEEQAKKIKKDLALFKKKKVTFRDYKIHLDEEELSPKKLKHIREEELHVSQRILAESLGVSVRTLQGWEIGKSKPTVTVLRLLRLMRDIPSVREELLPIAC